MYYLQYTSQQICIYQLVTVPNKILYLCFRQCHKVIVRKEHESYASWFCKFHYPLTAFSPLGGWWGKKVIITCLVILDVLERKKIFTYISKTFFCDRFKTSGCKFPYTPLLEMRGLCPLHLNMGRLWDCFDQQVMMTEGTLCQFSILGLKK